MANQVEPGTRGGAAEESGGLGGASVGGADQTQGALDDGTRYGAPGEEVAVGAAGTAGVHQAFHGRPVSWVAVSLIMTGFVVGGLALIFGPTWVVFWIGVGLAVIGGLLGMATNIFEDWY